MKRAFAAACLALVVQAAAERPAAAQARTPEETAKAIAARWKPILGLSDEQTLKFEKVALDAEKATAQARAKAGGDPEMLKAAMQPIYQQRNASVEKILTPGQMQKYDAAMAVARKKAVEKPTPPVPAKPPA